MLIVADARGQKNKARVWINFSLISIEMWNHLRPGRLFNNVNAKISFSLLKGNSIRAQNVLVPPKDSAVGKIFDLIIDSQCLVLPALPIFNLLFSHLHYLPIFAAPQEVLIEQLNQMKVEDEKFETRDEEKEKEKAREEKMRTV